MLTACSQSTSKGPQYPDFGPNATGYRLTFNNKLYSVTTEEINKEDIEKEIGSFMYNATTPVENGDLVMPSNYTGYAEPIHGYLKPI